MKLSFDTFLGDVEVEVIGNYDMPDKSVGYFGSFEVEHVNVGGIDIISMLSSNQLDRLEDVGMEAYHQQKDDAKHDAAEARYQQSREA